MPTKTKRTRTTNPPQDPLDKIYFLLQDLFILEGRKAGMSVKSLREVLKVAKGRVTNISKRMNLTKTEGDEK